MVDILMFELPYEKHKKYPGFYYELFEKYDVFRRYSKILLNMEWRHFSDELEDYINYGWDPIRDRKLLRIGNRVVPNDVGTLTGYASPDAVILYPINVEIFERNPDYIIAIKNPHCSMQFIKMPKVIEGLLSFEQYDCKMINR